MSFSYDKIIIDGNNLLYRAFFTKRPARIINDLNISTIEQFLYMLKSVAVKFKPKEVILTWDKKLNQSKKNFRKELLAYKEQRVENEKTIELLNNINHIQKFIDCLGIKTIYPYSTEADDVIRFLCKKFSNCLVISNDKDLLQLVDENTHVYLPNKDIVVTNDNFEQNAGISKQLFVLFKSITGDVSDNVEGLQKYGPVRAKTLAEKIQEHLDFSKCELTDEQIQTIKTNLKVVDLSYLEKEHPEEYENFEQQLQNSQNCKYDSENLKNLFKEYELLKFYNNYNEWGMIFNTNKNKNDLLSFIKL